MDEQKTGEISLYVVKFSKAELLSVDDAQRDLYLQLSQLSNEIFMLYNFLIRSMNGMDAYLASGSGSYAKLRKARKLIVETDVFQRGGVQQSFDVAGLEFK